METHTKKKIKKIEEMFNMLIRKIFCHFTGLDLAIATTVAAAAIAAVSHHQFAYIT